MRLRSFSPRVWLDRYKLAVSSEKLQTNKGEQA